MFATEKENHRATVLHVISHLEKGGAERQLDLLVRGSEHKHIIATLNANKSSPHSIIEPINVDSPLKLIVRIRTLCKHYKVDIVQLWLPDRLTIPSALAAYSLGVRIISGDRRRVRNYGRYAFRDRVKYASHFLADCVVSNYPLILPYFSVRRLLRIAHKTISIYNGVEKPPFERRKIESAPTRLLFVGRLVEQKRVNEVVQSLPFLLSSTNITGMDIVGDGHLMESLKNQVVEVGVSEAVVFHGTRLDWVDIFDPSTHFLILPSVSEGMSNTVFEAVQSGFFPIIRSSPEMCAVTADWRGKPYMLPAINDSELSKALNELTSLTKENLNSQVEGMILALANLSVEKMCSEYDQLYESMTLQI